MNFCKKKKQKKERKKKKKTVPSHKIHIYNHFEKNFKKLKLFNF